MKPVVLDSTTFRVFEVTLGGFEERGTVQNILNELFTIPALVVEWLAEFTPGHDFSVSKDQIDDRTVHYEIWLTFARPEDAVAFRLRWCC